MVVAYMVPVAELASILILAVTGKDWYTYRQPRNGEPGEAAGDVAR